MMDGDNQLVSMLSATYIFLSAIAASSECLMSYCKQYVRRPLATLVLVRD